MFCGFGGAGYFPNTIRCPGKNDLEIGQAREQLFAHNFLPECYSKGSPFRFTAQDHTEFVDAFYRIAPDRENKIVILTGVLGGGWRDRAAGEHRWKAGQESRRRNKSFITC